jgi:CHAT domain-containing protein
MNFLLQLLRIASNQPSPQTLYPLLQANLDKVNITLAEALQLYANQTLPKLNFAQKQIVAASIGNLSILFHQFPFNRADSLEIAIAGYEITNSVFTRESFPTQWANTQQNLADAYLNRIQGDRAKNIEKAIMICEQVLELYKFLKVHMRSTLPEQWAGIQNNLANAYFSRMQGERSDNIEKAIAAYEKALVIITKSKSPDHWAGIQNNLANAYFSRMQGERSKNIEQAISSYKKALEIRTKANFPQEWAETQASLAFVYFNRMVGNRADNIEQVITAYENALEVLGRVDAPKELAKAHYYLAQAYSNRIYGKRVENIEQAIFAYKKALEVYNYFDFPGEWASIHQSLANSYRERIQGNHAENIERMIYFCEKALEVFTKDNFSEEWANTQNSLANAYYSRIQGNIADNLEQAIIAYQRSLEIFTKEDFPKQWAMVHSNLANAYRDRIRHDRAENIEEAIVCCQRALEVRKLTDCPEEWADTQVSLANTYAERILGDRAQNIEDAITAYGHALRVHTREDFPEKWAMTQHNLAVAITKRILGDRAQNIDNAITAYQNVLQVHNRDDLPEEWAMTQRGLADAYRDRIRGNREQNIEEAITSYKYALKILTRDNFPDEWAMTQLNLALAYRDRIRGNREQNIEEAITCCKHALQVHTREDFPEKWAMTQHNLALAYKNRRLGAQAQNIEEAITAYTQALEIRTPAAHPNECRSTARQLANLYADETRWPQAQTTYRTALEAAETLYQAALSKGSQEAELKETDDLYRRAAYAYAKVGDVEAAIATIEQGRARSLSETLQRDRADLEAVRQINPDLVVRYDTAAAAIRLQESAERRNGFDRNQPQSSPEDRRNQAIQARQALQASIADIRQIPGYETFLALPTFADIVATLHPGQPLIYLVPTPNGSLALAVSLPPSQQGSRAEGEGQPAPQAAAIWLNNFTETDLRNLLVNDTNTGWFNAYQNQTQDRAAWFAAIDRTLNALWQPVLVPILGHLSQAKCPAATLIPAGLFSLLPLHAAWTVNAQGQRRYACDFIQFTYAPNALALGAARQVAHHTPAQKLLAINEPFPVSASDLPSASAETVKAVSAFAGSGNFKILQHEAATPAAVLAALPSYPVAHFSCHGSANFRIPLDSGLLMANDAVLSLRALLDLKLTGLRLAILSACETGIPGTDLPDEVVSLPTGLLQAGAAGVVASLWSVADLSTMLLLSRFCDLWRPQSPEATPLEPPEALRQAQLWLRDSTGPELAPYLQAAHPDIAAQLAQAKDKRPFAHPFYWAAFTYTGV